MATHVYANIVGTWVDLTEDDSCVMGPHFTSPYIWWEENAEIYSPIRKEQEHTFYNQDYVHVRYKNIDYRLQPCHIQIVQK
ncbi:hypothetical protein SAMN04488100_10560 [Alkalibacterium putridalgicola]|uniref:Uncharacterized protein n=1 Tax=Alkalibacterium putridalgicola TaxID=426703 RepID=A0A1H7RNQ6_9LACT|nr:hypothetical protein [Alkalibacterium putridalgicola]GEK88919.1 hypothetical protein APU01nite_09580 [Alkalibacterium putridalgicola]SEL61861.1 hypothetical protein SAMN04488100_10560 [Alkalibacterium putridalgicola]